MATPSINDLSTVIDELVIVSFIIQLSINEFSDYQKDKIISKLKELLFLLEGVKS